MIVTRFRRANAPRGDTYELTWPYLGRVLTTRRPWLGDDHPGWAPTTFRGNYRSLENVEKVHALCLDYDYGPTIDEAQATFGGFAAIIQTTRRHTPEAHRFRLVLRLSRPVTVDEYARLWPLVASHAGQVDPCTKDASRFWYLPGCDMRSQFIGIVTEGRPVDVDRALSRASAPAPVARPADPVSIDPSDRQRTRARAYLASIPPAVSGQGGHQQTWRAAVSLVRGFGLSNDHALEELRTWNAQCQPPWSERELRHKVEQAAQSGLRAGYLLEDERRA